MTIGPISPASSPRFADLVAAADARRRVGEAALLRPLGPRPSTLLPLPEVRSRVRAEGEGLRLDGFDALDLEADLPLPALLDNATALASATRTLRILAAARSQTPARVLERMASTPQDRLPSQNRADARSDFSTFLRVKTEDGRVITANVHVARLEDGRWEISAFDQALAGATPFPYSAPPLFVTTAEFDPVRAEFIAGAMLAGAIAPRARQSAEPVLFDLRAGVAALALVGIFGLLLLSRESWPVVGAIGAVAGIVALHVYLRKTIQREKKGVSGRRRSARR